MIIWFPRQQHSFISESLRTAPWQIVEMAPCSLGRIAACKLLQKLLIVTVTKLTPSTILSLMPVSTCWALRHAPPAVFFSERLRTQPSCNIWPWLAPRFSISVFHLLCLFVWLTKRSDECHCWLWSEIMKISTIVATITISNNLAHHLLGVLSSSEARKHPADTAPLLQWLQCCISCA